MRNTVLRMAVFMLGPLFSGNLAAQTTNNCQQFVGQTEWIGTFTLTGTGSGTTAAGDSYSVNESIVATPDLISKAFSTWIGTLNETIHINDTYVSSDGFLVAHITDDEMLTNGAISALRQTLPALVSVRLPAPLNSILIPATTKSPPMETVFLLGGALPVLSAAIQSAILPLLRAPSLVRCRPADSTSRPASLSPLSHRSAPRSHGR